MSRDDDRKIIAAAQSKLDSALDRIAALEVLLREGEDIISDEEGPDVMSWRERVNAALGGKP